MGVGCMTVSLGILLIAAIAVLVLPAAVAHENNAASMTKEHHIQQSNDPRLYGPLHAAQRYQSFCGHA